MRAACKIAPYAIAGGCCHCYSIHRIWKRRQSICGQAAPPDLLRWNKRSAAIVLNNITRQTQIGHERKLLWCASSDYNSASTFLACSTHVFICALHPIHTHFLPLRSDRLPNWTPLDRSSTSNPWRRRFFVLSVEFLRLSKFMCVSACCIIIHSRIFFHVFVFVFELSFVACVFAPFPSNKRRRNNNFETKKNKKKKEQPHDAPAPKNKRIQLPRIQIIHGVCCWCGVRYSEWCSPLAHFSSSTPNDVGQTSIEWNGRASALRGGSNNRKTVFPTCDKLICYSSVLIFGFDNLKMMRRHQATT